MNKFVFAALATSLAASPGWTQTTGGSGPAAGTGNAAAAASNNREENASYNRVIGSSTRPLKKGKAVAAAPADVIAGSPLRDIRGVTVGTVESIEGDSAVVATMAGRVKIPLIGFGKDRAGLMLSMTAAELEAAVKAANGG